MAATTLMSNQAVVGAGNWTTIDPAKPRSVQIVMTGSASVDIEVSNDGITPAKIQTAITASGVYVDSDPYEYIRVNVTSITSGAVSVTMSAPK